MVQEDRGDIMGHTRLQIGGRRAHVKQTGEKEAKVVQREQRVGERKKTKIPQKKIVF
jgi:hypothetical protein